jgi:hypothetical protein
MEIHCLKVSLTEEDINALVAEFPARDSAVENLRVRLSNEGIVVLGEYPAMFMKMAFETLWQVSAIGSVVVVRLASVKVSGLPAGMLRGVLLKTIRDMVAHEPGIHVENETIRIDLSRHTGAQRLRLRLHLTGVRCGPDGFVIEAGPAIA